jgi:succinoglycan biosynthesis transport protein ExoP
MADQSNDSPKKTQPSRRTIRIVVVALVVLGFIWNEKHPEVPMYRGTATIQVSQRMNGKILYSDDQNSGSDYYLRKLKTIVASLANTDLMKQVIIDHDLLNNSAFTGRDASSESLGMLARNLAGRTSATLREETELIDVSVSFHDRELARDLVNWVAHGFVEQHSSRRLNMNRYANGVLTNEAERLKIKLRNAEVALIDFRRTSRLIVSLEERRSIVGSRVASLSQSKDVVDGNLARLGADLNLVESFGEEPSASQLELVRSIWDSEEIRRYREMLIKVEMNLEELTLRHEESHPGVTGEKSMLRRVEVRLFESMKKRANRLGAEYQRLQKERDVINQQLSVAENESLSISEMSVEYNVLEREVQGTKTLYSSVLERIKEIDLSTGLLEEVITMIEPASGATLTSSRGSSRWVSGLTGLVLALAGIFLFDNVLPRLKPKS